MEKLLTKVIANRFAKAIEKPQTKPREKSLE
jgi:hypothetical protein